VWRKCRVQIWDILTSLEISLLGAGDGEGHGGMASQTGRTGGTPGSTGGAGFLRRCILGSSSGVRWRGRGAWRPRRGGRGTRRGARAGRLLETVHPRVHVGRVRGEHDRDRGEAAAAVEVLLDGAGRSSLQPNRGGYLGKRKI
jgi:hypothetical protein